MESAIPGRDRIYFGWRVIVAMVIISASLIGISISAFVMLSVPFQNEFGWSESQTGALVSAMWLTGPFALVLGPVVARVGAWRMVSIGLVLQVLALALIRYSTDYEEMVALRVVMGIGMVIMVPAAPVIVAQWFRRRFSTAMAIVWSASSGGQIVFGPLTVWLVENFGWRTTVTVLAAMLALALALALVLTSGAKSPEQLGVDVAAVEGPDEHAEEHPEHSGFWRSILSINWFAAAVMSLGAFGAGATSIALQAQSPVFFDTMGMSQATAALLLSIFASSALAGVLFSGWMLDRRPIIANSLLVSATVFAGTIGLWLVIGHPAFVTAAIAMALIGFGLGAGEIMWVTLFKRQFGVRLFATTYGLFYCCFQLGMAAGGPVGGLSFEWFGAAGFVGILAISYAAPAIFSAWRPGKMVHP